MFWKSGLRWYEKPDFDAWPRQGNRVGVRPKLVTDFDMHPEEHGFVVRHGGRRHESVFLHSFHGIFREDRVGAANNARVLRKSLSVNDDGKGAEALQLLPSSLIGNFGFRRQDCNGRMNDRGIEGIDLVRR